MSSIYQNSANTITVIWKEYVVIISRVNVFCRQRESLNFL